MNPEWLEKLQSMPALWSVELYGPGLTDASLNVLSGIKPLATIAIEQISQVSDEGIAKFRAKRPDVHLGIVDKVHPAGSKPTK